MLGAMSVLRRTRRAMVGIGASLAASVAICGCGVILGFEPLEFGGGEIANGDGSVVDGFASGDGLANPDGGAPVGDGSGPTHEGDACDREMVRIPRGYCIDRTEVTDLAYSRFLDAVDAGLAPEQPPECAWNTDFQMAIAGVNDLPALVDWCDAYAFCKWAGKRLCGRIGGGPFVDGAPKSDSQWYTACSAEGTRTFPYGALYDDSRCAFSGPITARALPWTVETKTCQGGYDGIYDMLGNAGEWEDSCTSGGADAASDQCAVLGGAFDRFDGEFISCTERDFLPRSMTTGTTGFRCCSLE
jgi:formylglycine-generating enzyme required for sulfatase activity